MSVTTRAELYEAAAIRPVLLLKAVELTRDRADADDLLQDTFETLIHKPPDPRSEAQPRCWLRTVMTNRRRSHWRAVTAGPADPLDYEPVRFEP